MAQVDVQWPTEDEDFDATLEKAKSKSAVTVIDNDEDDEPEERFTAPEIESKPDTAPDEKPANADEDGDAQDEPAEAEAEPETETKPEEPDEPEETAPEPQHVEPAAIVPPTHNRLPVTASPGKGRGSMLRLALEFVLVVALVGVGLWAWTLQSDNKDLKQQVVKLNSNPQIAAQKQTQALIAQVGHLIDLPKGETPTVANVSDAVAAKKQSAFFNNAQNGDKVLMYVKAGEAILYRPSTDKIILVAPLTFNNTTPTAATTTPAKTTTTTPTTTTKAKP